MEIKAITKANEEEICREIIPVLQRKMAKDFQAVLENPKTPKETIIWLKRKALLHSRMAKEFAGKYIAGLDFCGRKEDYLQAIMPELMYIHDWGRVCDVDELLKIKYGASGKNHCIRSFERIIKCLDDNGYSIDKDTIFYHIMLAIKHHSFLTIDGEDAILDAKIDEKLLQSVFSYVCRIDRISNIFMYIGELNSGDRTDTMTHDLDRVGEVVQSAYKKASIVSQPVLQSILNFQRVRVEDCRTITDVHLKLLSFIFNNGKVEDDLVQHKDAIDKFMTLIETRALRYRDIEDDCRQKTGEVVSEVDFQNTIASLLKVRLTFHKRGIVEGKIINEENKKLYQQLTKEKLNEVFASVGGVKETMKLEIRRELTQDRGVEMKF